MRRSYILSALVAFMAVAEAAGQQPPDKSLRAPSPELNIAILKEQFAGQVIPLPIREELKAAIRKHLVEDGPAPLGGELFFNERGLAMRLIAERNREEKRQHAKVLAGVRKLKSGQASDSGLLIEYGEQMIEQVKESYNSPPPHSRFAEFNQRRRDGQLLTAGSALKLLGLATKLPRKNVATMAGVYETSVLGTAHPTYKILPSRMLTMRGDRCGVLLVKFEVFDPSAEELDALRKASGLPLVILDISKGYARIRLDDDGLSVLGKGKLQDLFPTE